MKAPEGIAGRVCDWASMPLADLKDKVVAGNPAAQIQLGFRYLSGLDGLPKDPGVGFGWFCKAAGQGDAFAQYILGSAYDSGHFLVRQDFAQAASWYRMAAEGGNAQAQNSLGFCYASGHGIPEDAGQAVKWYRRAAEQGHVGSQYNLGVCCLKGYGVPQDLAEGANWFRQAAEQGYAPAKNRLGVCYSKGCGVPQDLSEAVKWLREASEQGDASAQNNLGTCYQDGKGVTKNMAEAAEWFRLSAAQGYAGGQSSLGMCYHNGEGVAKDPAEAAQWYRKASDQGDAEAQFFLGMMYYDGEGVLEDLGEAVKWIRASAEQGNEMAQTVLGGLYIAGKGVTQDLEEATRWFNAAERGREATRVGAAPRPPPAVAKESGNSSPPLRESEQSTVNGKLGVRPDKPGEKVPPDPVQALKDSFWASKLPDTLESIATFLAGGGLGKALADGSTEAVVEAVAKDAVNELLAQGATKEVAEKMASEFATHQIKSAVARLAQVPPDLTIGTAMTLASKAAKGKTTAFSNLAAHGLDRIPPCDGCADHAVQVTDEPYAIFLHDNGQPMLGLFVRNSTMFWAPAAAPMAVSGPGDVSLVVGCKVKGIFHKTLHLTLQDKDGGRQSLEVPLASLAKGFEDGVFGFLAFAQAASPILQRMPLPGYMFTRGCTLRL
jgi:TPR repeat protein